MIEMVRNWRGPVEVNGVFYNSIRDVRKADFKAGEKVHIRLLQNNPAADEFPDTPPCPEWRINVKSYMTKEATDDFNFMEKFNHNQPMPFRVMIGTIEKETRGMYYMKLHGDIYANTITRCMKCGRVLTNPVSQYFGIGPECGGHHYVHPFDTDEELKEAVASYRKQLQKVTWEGWVIKSAITEMEEVK